MTLLIAFRGPYRFLSNDSWCTVTWKGVEYPSVTHAFQCAQTFDKAKQEEIKKTKRFTRVRRIGKTALQRPGWEKIQLAVLESLLRQKFAQPKFRQVLLSTKDYKLINGDHRGETYWGMIYHCHKWLGENHLGKLLMKIREDIQKEEAGITAKSPPLKPMTTSPPIPDRNASACFSTHNS